MHRPQMPLMMKTSMISKWHPNGKDESDLAGGLD
jgi:hypothetical protein